MMKPLIFGALLALCSAPLSLANTQPQALPNGCHITSGMKVIKGHTFYAFYNGQRELWMAPGGVYRTQVMGQRKVYMRCEKKNLGGKLGHEILPVPVQRGTDGQSQNIRTDQVPVPPAHHIVVPPIPKVHWTNYD